MWTLVGDFDLDMLVFFLLFWACVAFMLIVLLKVARSVRSLKIIRRWTLVYAKMDQYLKCDISITYLIYAAIDHSTIRVNLYIKPMIEDDVGEHLGQYLQGPLTAPPERGYSPPSDTLLYLFVWGY